VFVYFLGVLVHAYPILRFHVLFVFFWFLGVCPILIVLVISLGSYSIFFIDIFEFLLRKKE